MQLYNKFTVLKVIMNIFIAYSTAPYLIKSDNNILFKC